MQAINCNTRRNSEWLDGFHLVLSDRDVLRREGRLIIVCVAGNNYKFSRFKNAQHF
jgi:hypothetical protein